MSYRDTRIFICNMCGKEEEGTTIKARGHAAGMFMFLPPIDWKSNDGVRHFCNECAEFIEEVKRQATEGK